MLKLLSQLRFAFRSISKRPGFAVLAVLTLALGIGPTTAVFAVFQQVLLRELPVHNPNELVLLEHSGSDTGSLNDYGGTSPQYFSAPAFRALRTALPQLAAAAMRPVDLTVSRQAVHATSELVSGNYFSVLGEQPILGRLFTQDDDRTHAGNQVIVLTENFWRTHLGANPAVLLLLSVFLAALLPTLRAANTNPSEALRAE